MYKEVAEGLYGGYKIVRKTTHIEKHTQRHTHIVKVNTEYGFSYVL